MNITERKAQVKATLSEEFANDRYVVIPNDAPAYQMQGAWGIYDMETCFWKRFARTEEAARELMRALELNG